MIAREANENPKINRESSKEPWGTLGNSQNSGELQGTPGNSEELQGTPGNSRELRGTPGNSGKLRGKKITCLFFQILRITTQSTHGFKTEIPFKTSIDRQAENSKSSFFQALHKGFIRIASKTCSGLTVHRYVHTYMLLRLVQKTKTWLATKRNNTLGITDVCKLAHGIFSRIPNQQIHEFFLTKNVLISF